MQTVAVFYSIVEAQLFKAFLESHRVACFLADEHIVSINPLYASAVGGIKINVHSEFLEKAIALYDDFQNGREEAVIAEPCPQCQSENTMPLPPNPSVYYNEFRCFDCDHIWDDQYLHTINPGHIE